MLIAASHKKAHSPTNSWRLQAVSDKAGQLGQIINVEFVQRWRKCNANFNDHGHRDALCTSSSASNETMKLRLAASLRLPPLLSALSFVYKNENFHLSICLDSMENNFVAVTNA